MTDGSAHLTLQALPAGFHPDEVLSAAGAYTLCLGSAQAS